MSGADVFRFVSRRELLYTIQSLKALEHCLLPFLDDCDTDNDDKITLWEWGRCLGLEEGNVSYTPLCRYTHTHTHTHARTHSQTKDLI